MRANEMRAMPGNQPAFPPDFARNYEVRNWFTAERQFLRALPHIIAPEIIEPKQQLDTLENHIADLSSTDIAHEVVLAYGLRDNQIRSDATVAAHMTNTQSGVVGVNRSLALQTLWIMYGSKFSSEVYSWVKNLHPKYTQTDRSASQQVIYDRARRNIAYYEDRLFILRHEYDVIRLMEMMYKRLNRADAFSQYYRLGRYKNRDRLERQGCFRIANEKERFQLQDTLEAGRAATEHFSNLEIGERSWQNLNGERKAGYTRTGTQFKSLVDEFIRQDQVAEAVRKKGNLSKVEIQLLKFSTKIILSGGTKAEAINKFNKAHKTRYSQEYILVLERKALRTLENENISRMEVLGRMHMTQTLLDSSELQKQLGSKLAEIIYDYHMGNMSLDQIAETLVFPERRIVALKPFLERLLDPSHEAQRTRGNVTDHQIKTWFPDNALPPAILDILKEFLEPISTTQIAEKLTKKDMPSAKIKEGLKALEALATDIVTKATSQ